MSFHAMTQGTPRNTYKTPTLLVGWHVPSSLYVTASKTFRALANFKIASWMAKLGKDPRKLLLLLLFLII